MKWNRLRNLQLIAHRLRNKKGFVLAELLLSLTIFLTILAFIPITLQLTLNHGWIDRQLQGMEWEVFALQLKKDIHLAQEIEVHNNKLFLPTDNRMIHYEQFGQTIRRRVDGTGHEVSLQGVRSVQFIQIKNGVKLVVEDHFLQIYELKTWSYVQKGEQPNEE